MGHFFQILSQILSVSLILVIHGHSHFLRGPEHSINVHGWPVLNIQLKCASDRCFHLLNIWMCFCQPKYLLEMSVIFHVFSLRPTAMTFSQAAVCTGMLCLSLLHSVANHHMPSCENHQLVHDMSFPVALFLLINF